MKILKPSFYDEFHCIGADCQYTCCQGWTVIIGNEEKQRYEKFSEKLTGSAQKCLISNGGEGYEIKMDEKNLCPFLSDEGWCRLVMEEGEEALGYVCTTYPRERISLPNTNECSLSMGCPAVVDFLYQIEGPFSFVLEDDGEKRQESSLGEELLERVKDIEQAIEFDLEIRNYLIDILQERKYPLWFRLFICAYGLDKIKKLHKEGDLDDVLTTMYGIYHRDNLAQFYEGISKIPVDKEQAFYKLKSIFESFQSAVVTLNGKDKNRTYQRAVDLLIKNDRCKYEEYQAAVNAWSKIEQESFEIIMEHAAVFGWYSTALESMNEYYLLDNMLKIVINQVLIKHLTVLYYAMYHKMTKESQIFIISFCTRMVQHAGKNMEEIVKKMKEDGILSIAGILLLLKGSME